MAFFLRSPHAFVAIRTIDIPAAVAFPGVTPSFPNRCHIVDVGIDHGNASGRIRRPHRCGR